MAQKQQLRELGSKLDSPPASKDALIKLLKVGFCGDFLLEFWPGCDLDIVGCLFLVWFVVGARVLEMGAD